MVLENIFIHKQFNYALNECVFKYFEVTLDALQAVTAFIKPEFSWHV
jgi:hypothetical protein